MSDTDQLPDGVMRMYEDGCGHFAESDEDIILINTPDAIFPVTLVTGHGRVREMWAVVRETGDVVSVWNTATDAQNASFFCSMPVTIRRCIVVEMDNTATPQEGSTNG